MWKRIIYSIIVFSLVFLTPWWVSIIFAIAGAFYFKLFIELIFVGMFIDSIYGNILFDDKIAFMFTLATSVLLGFISFLKDRMIGY